MSDLDKWRQEQSAREKSIIESAFKSMSCSNDSNYFYDSLSTIKDFFNIKTLPCKKVWVYLSKPMTLETREYMLSRGYVVEDDGFHRGDLKYKIAPVWWDIPINNN